MKIMTQFHLGPKKSVIIIRVAGEFLLLGVTDHSINLIKTLSLIDDEFEENSSNFDHLISDETSEKVSFYKDKVSLNNKKTKQDEDLLLEIKNLVTDKLKDLKKLN
jgi:flagellar protein FliO/FliZ